MNQENAIASIVVDAAIEVHRTLGGPGLLEDLYEEALHAELCIRGLSSETTASHPSCLQRSQTSLPVEIGHASRGSVGGGEQVSRAMEPNLRGPDAYLPPSNKSSTRARDQLRGALGEIRDTPSSERSTRDAIPLTILKLLALLAPLRPVPRLCVNV